MLNMILSDEILDSRRKGGAIRQCLYEQWKEIIRQNLLYLLLALAAPAVVVVMGGWVCRLWKVS